jgi:hypothetical protein
VGFAQLGAGDTTFDVAIRRRPRSAWGTDARNERRIGAGDRPRLPAHVVEADRVDITVH